jgi:2-polyprenyl-3-methyl-5-hydroxy-6-metoxy-1,4-benzoquinol methylase
MWNKVYSNGDDFAQLNTAEVSFLLDSINFKGIQKHLDIGCGTGALNRDIYLRGIQTIGVDPSESAITVAKESIDARFGDVFFCKQVQDIDDKDFTLITSKYVYKFLEDRKEFLRNVEKRLNTGGIFVIIDPIAEYLPEDKKSIVLPEAVVVNDLKELFTVEVQKYRKNTYYFARKRK